MAPPKPQKHRPAMRRHALNFVVFNSLGLWGGMGLKGGPSYKPPTRCWGSSEKAGEGVCRVEVGPFLGRTNRGPEPRVLKQAPPSRHSCFQGWDRVRFPPPRLRGHEHSNGIGLLGSERNRIRNHPLVLGGAPRRRWPPHRTLSRVPACVCLPASPGCVRAFRLKTAQ